MATSRTREDLIPSLLKLSAAIKANTKAQTKCLERLESFVTNAIPAGDDNIGDARHNLLQVDYGNDSTVGGGIIHYVVADGAGRYSLEHKARHYPSTEYSNATPDTGSSQVLQSDWHYCESDNCVSY